MKKILFAILILLLINDTYAQGLKLDWGVGEGGTGDDQVGEICVSSQGEVVIVGSFYTTVDFDPGPSVSNLVSAGYYDIFIQKLDTNGQLIWVKRIGGTGSQIAYACTVDALGNIFITGTFGGSTDFDPGLGTAYHTSQYGMDIFVLKLNSSGDFQWVSCMGGLLQENGNDIALDQFGNIYVTGEFEGTVDFDPGSGTNNLTSLGNKDGFIVKLSANGSLSWAKAIGGTSLDFSNSINIDQNNAIVLTGCFNGTVDFNLGSGVYNLTSAGSADAWVLKLNMNGGFIWAKQLGSNLTEFANSLTTDLNNNVLVTGYFTGISDFDPGTATYNLTSNGGGDVFILKLNSLGNFVWAKSMGGGVSSSNDYGSSIVTDNSGNVFTVGSFKGIIDLNTDTGTFLAGSSNGSIFVHKLNSNGNFIWASISGFSSQSCGASSVFADQSNNIYVGGAYKSSFYFGTTNNHVSYTSNGNGDAFILKTSPCYPLYNTVYDTACDVYSLNGITYTQSGSYSYIAPSYYGCDSIITLNLIIHNSSVVLDNQVHCDSFMWIDSVVYTQSNYTATHTLTGVHGCDSVITLYLTITKPDTSVIQNGAVLSSNQPFASYQWLNCDDFYAPLTNDTLQSFTAKANGHYAVEVSLGNCVDTSSCSEVTGLSAISNDLHNYLYTIYPNPTNGKFTIDLGKGEEDITITIFNILGERVIDKHFASASIIDLDIIGNPGLYFVSLQSKNRTTVTFKIVKK